MRFAGPLERGRLLRRTKRFLADVRLDSGAEVTAACPNTGSMLGLSAPGLAVWLSRSANPARKYAYTWEMVEAEPFTPGAAPVLTGINTGHPNAIAAEAIAAGRIPSLAGYKSLRREVAYGRSSRIDILLEDGEGKRTYVEIKNVHLMRKAGLAEFPDSVTRRGAKHLEELADVVRSGHRAVLLFLIQREDAETFTLAAGIDPAYAAAWAAARRAGVETLAFRCRLSPGEIVLDRPVTVAIPEPAAPGAA